MTERVRAWEPVLQDLEHEPQLVQPETTQLTGQAKVPRGRHTPSAHRSRLRSRTKLCF